MAFGRLDTWRRSWRGRGLGGGPALRGLRRSGSAAVLLIAALAVSFEAAAASPPWTPSIGARHRLEWLVDAAGLELPLSQWPLPRAAVEAALDRLPADLPGPLADARAALRSELRAAAGPGVRLGLRSAGEQPSGFGDAAAPGSSADARTGTLAFGPVAAQLGLHTERTTAAYGDAERVDGSLGGRLEGSAVGIEVLGLEWQAWSHRSWWGPGWQSSLLLGNNAPALLAAGVQRAAAGRSESPWLAWLGPWTFEAFIGRLANVAEPARPMLFGSRLTFRPLPLVEIGLVRTAQWGGQGRPHSLRTFGDLLIGRDVNADTPEEQPKDPANEMAGYDLRVTCAFGMRCAGYLQLIGEDMGGLLPSRYLGAYGIETWSEDGRHRWFAELAETGCRMPVGQPALSPCAYRNYAYPGGYVDGRRWLGANWGPDARMLTLGWIDGAVDGTLKLHYGRVPTGIGAFDPGFIDPARNGTLTGLSYTRAWRYGALKVAPELAWSRLRTETGMQVNTRVGVALDYAFDGR